MTSKNTKFFRDWLESMSLRGDKSALRFKKNRAWKDISWRQYRDRVEQLSAGLIGLGVKPGDRVAVFSSTRYEWAFMDLASLAIGAVVVPVYPTGTAEELEHILTDSGCKILAIENRSLLKVFKAVEAKCPQVEKLIVFESTMDSSLGRATSIGNREELTLEKVMLHGQNQLEGSASEDIRIEMTTRLAALTVDTTATLVYTSGTTGKPKGVVITHRQIASEVNESFEYAGARADDISLSFLPYSHVLGRIELWGSLAIGYTMAFAESIEKIRGNLQEIKPTIMVAVPRIFEKINLAIQAQVETNPVRKKLFAWALGIGKQVSTLKVKREPISLLLLPQFELADRLVLKKVRDAFGGHLRFAISGGAPLSPGITEFFHACGVMILEGYGLTETTAAITVNTPFDYVIGTVGKPIGDVQLKIAEDGEILVKSDKVMKEYYKDPESTKKAFTDGWFMTGDIGEILPTGQLRITDRKKDLIKTAGGKYVAPQKLEGLMKNNSLISLVHIHGDQRKYIVALVTLDPQNLAQFAKDRQLSTPGFEALTQHPAVMETVRKAVADANSQLASYESIKRFQVLPRDFTVESGELTPSLKIKRKVVDQRFKAELDALYS